MAANQFSPAQVRIFVPCGPRIEHLDASGGGTITRAFYVEPYTAYPWVELFLKGTVLDAGAGVFARIKPHADPIKPWFYCNDVQVHPFAPETITGQAYPSFTPSNDFSYGRGGPGGQQTQINNVLNNVDDHSYGSIVDFGTNPPLTPAQILAGGKPYPAGTSANPPMTGQTTVPGGKCGAYVIATYTPLIFLDGIGSSDGDTRDPFDFVNPTWTPIEKQTQIGRNLFFDLGTGIPAGGILDTFNKSEVIWEFSITRKMVPFLPSLTIGALNEKLNDVNSTLGNCSIPLHTARFVCPEPPPLLRAPDGATYYDITYKYMIRKLYDQYLEATSGAYQPGWIDWNHHLGVPTGRLWPNVQVRPMGYYPVIWNGGYFQTLGTNHKLYLYDSALTGLVPQPVPSIAQFKLLETEFTVGFKAGQ